MVHKEDLFFYCAEMLSLRPSVLIVMFVVQSVLTFIHLPEPENNSKDREYLVYQAKLAERAERYDEMAESMKHVTVLEIECSVEERKLLALAYNQWIGHRRASLRKLTSTENEADNSDTRKDEILMNYREQIKGEIRAICWTVLDILGKYVIPKSTTAHSQVFFYKMKGDYHRYLAEIEESAILKKMAEDGALSAYRSASDIARTELAFTNPIRLELALNFSIFYYEILHSPYGAYRVAKPAFDDALEELDTLSEENYEDSASIMRLLRDKLALWSLDMPSKDN